MFKLHLYWYSLNRNDRKENYGDALGPYIASKLSDRVIKRVEYVKSRKFKYFYKQYFTVGSILKRATSNSVVWGSGIMKADEKVAPAKFYAVRGPKTRARLMELGYEVPEIYGDPALLLPKLIPNNSTKKYKLGIIPHFVDFESIKLRFNNFNEVKVIDLITNDVEKTTLEILQCESIISSSLHGLIVSHAYGISALWVKFSNKLSGDNIKFYDYFESVGLIYDKAIDLNVSNCNPDNISQLLSNNIEYLLPKPEILQLRQQQLLFSCPFKIKPDNAENSNAFDFTL